MYKTTKILKTYFKTQKYKKNTMKILKKNANNYEKQKKQLKYENKNINKYIFYCKYIEQIINKTKLYGKNQ